VTDLGPNTTGLSGAAQRLLAGASAAAGRGPAPVHLWNPPHCGAIDMRIAADGSWHYMGSPIGRIAMVKLFATILRKDSNEFVLVTPVERVAIRVDDAPFVAVELACEPGTPAERLFVRTSLDDVVELSDDHPIRFETAGDGGLKPYIHVRGDLWALASRALTHELIERARVENLDKPAVLGGEQGVDKGATRSPRRFLGLRSGPCFFPIAPADEIEAMA